MKRNIGERFCRGGSAPGNVGRTFKVYYNYKGTAIVINQPLYYKSCFVSTCLNTLSVNLF